MADTVAQLLRLGVKPHELHMYGFQDRMQFSEGEYSGWSDDEGEDDWDDANENFALAQSTVGRRPDYGSGPGSDDSGYDGYDDEADEHDDAEIDDRDGGSFANRPAANGYAAITEENVTVEDGTAGDVVAIARNIAATRHPGVPLEELPQQEAMAILTAAAQQGGYQGDGAPRTATVQQTPAVGTGYDASPATLFRPEAYTNKQMAESAVWRQENKAVRLAKDAALQRYGKRFSELGQSQKDALLREAADQVNYKGDRRGLL
jgi:hypothetical protein